MVVRSPFQEREGIPSTALLRPFGQQMVDNLGHAFSRNVEPGKPLKPR